LFRDGRLLPREDEKFRRMGGRAGGHLLRNDFSIAWRAARKEAGLRGAVAAAAVLMSATTPIHAQTAATA